MTTEPATVAEPTPEVLPERDLDEYTLERDGQKRLRFRGELLSETTTHEHSGPASTRWLDLELYLTAGGRYVVAAWWRTCWQGENDRHAAEVVATREGLVPALVRLLGDGCQGAGLAYVAKALLDEADLEELLVEDADAVADVYQSEADAVLS